MASYTANRVAQKFVTIFVCLKFIKYLPIYEIFTVRFLARDVIGPIYTSRAY